MKNSRRQNRTRYKLKKVTDRKRLSVFKSNNHIYAQVINDEIGRTLVSASSLEKVIYIEKLLFFAIVDITLSLSSFAIVGLRIVSLNS